MTTIVVLVVSKRGMKDYWTLRGPMDRIVSYLMWAIANSQEVWIASKDGKSDHRLALDEKGEVQVIQP